MTDRFIDNIVFRKLEKSDDRDSFTCGVDPLDDFIKRYARQNQKLSIGVTYIASLQDDNVILGYYTLSSGEIQFEKMPSRITKRLPRYPIPIARIGRLARDITMKGKGIGSLLLMDAFERILRISDELGINGIEVDAKDEKAKEFYKSYGFEELLDDDLHLYISIKVIRKAFTSS